MDTVKISKIVDTEQGVFQSDPGMEPKVWDESTSEWTEINAPPIDEEEKVQRAVFQMMGLDVPFPDPLGPVHVKSRGQTAFSRVLIGQPRTHRKQQFFLSDDGDNFVRKGVLPSGVIAMLATRENILCVNRRGRFYRFDADVTFEKENTSGETWFKSVGPDERSEIQNESLVAVNQATEEIAVYKDGKVDIFEVDSSTDDRKYIRRLSQEIETGTREGMTVSYTHLTLPTKA